MFEQQRIFTISRGFRNSPLAVPRHPSLDPLLVDWYTSSVGTSEGAYKRWATPGFRERISTALRGNQHWRGRRHRPESKAKISAALTGRTLSTETRGKLSIAHSGKRLSEEHREKLAESHRRYPPGTEVRRMRGASRRYYKRHTVRVLKRQARWRKANPDYERGRSIQRRLRNKVAFVEPVSLKEIYKRDSGIC